MHSGKVSRLQLLFLLHAVLSFEFCYCETEPEWPKILSGLELGSENEETLRRIVKRLAPEKNGEYQIYQVFFGNADLLREWLKGAGTVTNTQGLLSVTGQPGVDFPALTTIPTTSFTCRGLAGGYYADLETNCQVFHICDNGRKISFLCPNGTIFQQSQLICDWWFKVDCGKSVELYDQSQEILDEQKRRSDSRKSKYEFKDFRDQSFEQEPPDNLSYDGKQNGRISPYDDPSKQNQLGFFASNKNTLQTGEKVPAQSNYRQPVQFNENPDYQQKKGQSYQTRGSDKKRIKTKNVPRNQTSPDPYRVTPSYMESTTFRGRESQQFAESAAFASNRFKESSGNARPFYYPHYPTKSPDYAEKSRGFRKETTSAAEERKEQRYSELRGRTTTAQPIETTESPCEDSVEATTEDISEKLVKEAQQVAETAAFVSNRGYKDSRQFYYRLFGGKEDSFGEENEKTAKTISSLQLATTVAPCDTEHTETTTVYPTETTQDYQLDARVENIHFEFDRNSETQNRNRPGESSSNDKPHKFHAEKFYEKPYKEKYTKKDEDIPKYGSISPYFAPEETTTMATTFAEYENTYSPLEVDNDRGSVTRNDLDDAWRTKAVTEKDLSPYDTSFTYKQGKVLSTLGPYVPFTKSYLQSTTANPFGHSGTSVKSLIPKLKSPAPFSGPPSGSSGTFSAYASSGTSGYSSSTSSLPSASGSSVFTRESSGYTSNPDSPPGPQAPSVDVTQPDSPNYSSSSSGSMLSSASYTSPVTSPAASSGFTPAVGSSPGSSSLYFTSSTTSPTKSFSRSPVYLSSTPSPFPSPTPLTAQPSISSPPPRSGSSEDLPPDRQHALNMLHSLQNLEADLPLTESPRQFSRGYPGGSSTLHSLALYFSTATDNFDSNETPDPISEEDPSERKTIQEVVEVPSLLTKHTIQSYTELFKLNNALEGSMNETVDPEEYTEDLDVQQSGDLFEDSRKENGTKLRELAQVFTHALSAYLSDPDSFKKALTEARPTEPPSSAEESGTTAYPSEEIPERDEVLDFSDDQLTRKRLTTYPTRETTETDLQIESSTMPPTEASTWPTRSETELYRTDYSRNEEERPTTPFGRDTTALNTEYGSESTDLYPEASTQSTKAPGSEDRRGVDGRQRKGDAQVQLGRISASGNFFTRSTVQATTHRPVTFQETRFNEVTTKSPATWWYDVTTYNPGFRSVDQTVRRFSKKPFQATTLAPTTYPYETTTQGIIRSNDVTQDPGPRSTEATISPNSVRFVDSTRFNEVTTPSTRTWTDRAIESGTGRVDDRRRKGQKDGVQNRVAGFQNNTVVSYSNVRTYGAAHAHSSFGWARPTSRKPEQQVAPPISDRLRSEVGVTGSSKGFEPSRTTYRPSSRFNEETLVTARSSYPKYSSFNSEEAPTTVETTAATLTTVPEDVTESRTERQDWGVERTTQRAETVQDEGQGVTETPALRDSTESLENAETTTVLIDLLDKRWYGQRQRVLEDYKKSTDRPETTTVVESQTLKEQTPRKENRTRQGPSSDLNQRKIEAESLETTTIPETTTFSTTPEYFTETRPYFDSSRSLRKRVRVGTTTEIPEAATYFTTTEENLTKPPKDLSDEKEQKDVAHRRVMGQGQRDSVKQDSQRDCDEEGGSRERHSVNQKTSNKQKESKEVEPSDQRASVGQGQSVQKESSKEKEQKELRNRRIQSGQRQSLDPKEPDNSTESNGQRVLAKQRQYVEIKESVVRKAGKDVEQRVQERQRERVHLQKISNDESSEPNQRGPGQKDTTPKQFSQKDSSQKQSNQKESRQKQSNQKQSIRKESGARLSNDHWTTSPEVTQLWRTSVFVDPSRINQGLEPLGEATTTEKTTTPFLKEEFSTWWIAGDEPTSFTLLPSSGFSGEATPKPLITTRSSITTTITSSVTSTNALPRDSFFALSVGKSNHGNDTGSQRFTSTKSNETEKEVAEKLFGNLNATSTSTLMRVMKQADRNETVRQLVLLLISHCREPDVNETMQQEKDQLLNALLRTPVNEFSSEESRALVAGIDRLGLPTVKARFDQGTRRKVRRQRTTTEVSRPTEEPLKADDRALELLRSLYAVAARWS